jgi:succinate-acetate transporter protein
VQLLAGLLESVSGNTLGQTLFLVFGSFWMSLAGISIPFFGVSQGTSRFACAGDR